jgi:hypothetical protein
MNFDPLALIGSVAAGLFVFLVILLLARINSKLDRPNVLCKKHKRCKR